MTIGFSSCVPRVARVALRCFAVCALAALAVVTNPEGAGLRIEAGERDAKAAQEPPSLYRPGTQVRPRPGAPRAPQDVSAVSWLVADADSGAVLAAHDAHRKLPPASTLKTLFALTVLPGLPAGLRHTVEAEELAGIGAGSSLVGVKEDLTYRVADLWRGVFLSSGNDAVRVLAALNGGWRATAEQMQDKARSLGARDTHVVSPDGYDAPGQVSSAYDLAVFGRAGLRNAEFAEYCATATARFPAGGWSYGIQNTNRLLTGAGIERYPGLVGVKNGYTSNAGNTLIAAARRGGRTLVVTVLRPQSGSGYAVYEEARSLLDWGFRAAGRVEAVGSLLPPRPAAGPQADPGSPPVREENEEVTAPGWPLAGAVAGAAGVGAASVALALRLRNGRLTRG
ncbi:D-alanyl-D-alanine carboxypeptidase family protein [Streptomyces europaeiscabiei]|uniref:D-alanyl-D-alanine carboxypeptidase family protein n=1 Tax=Streptomyces europaeiscabiei TaxID=146819 RepID=UPI0029B214A8|nr:serine hydrolase [Streptomyces europaeiscabiei]MDX3671998.1 D-alanyl-D-alanine carboxypeptidase [Streptomyces europaeiscabiei]